MFKTKLSKTLLVLFFAAIIGLGVWAFLVFKNRNEKDSALLPTRTETFSNDSSNSIAATDDLLDDGDADNHTTNTTDQQSPTDNNQTSSTEGLVPNPKLSGNMLANITPQHCDDSCAAFKIDLELFEYCEQACGISPVKKVSSCSNENGIRKDYCLKNLAIGNKNTSDCEKIKDDNIKKACAVIIEENTFREMQQQTGTQRENPSF